jgi:hypothetical protein
MSWAGEGPQLHLGQGFADTNHGFQLKEKNLSIGRNTIQTEKKNVWKSYLWTYDLYGPVRNAFYVHEFLHSVFCIQYSIQ